MSQFLKQAVDKLFIYKTPKAIIKHIESDLIIKNPPYDVRKSTK